jgi:di/tricarboxylate transporter
VSAFINNTTLVAMTVPAVLDICRRRGLSPSRFLIPISFATVLGGVQTTVGTSTNLTVSGLLDEAGMAPLGLFELTPVGVPIAFAGTLVVVLLADRLLPDRGSAARQPGDATRDFTVSMRVQPGGAIDGKSVEDGGLRHLHGVFLVEIARGDRIIAPVAPTEVLEGGDVLTFVGRVDDVVDLHRMRGLESAEARQIDHLAGSGQAFYEAVIGPELVNATLQEVGFRARYGAAVLAIHRAGQRLDAKLGEVRLHLGDTLLVLADRRFRARYRDGRDFLLVAPLRAIPLARGSSKAPIVGLIGLGFILTSGTGLLPILNAALLAAVLVIATGVLTVRQARDAIDLNIVVLIAAAFGLGAAVEGSGLGQVLADLLVGAMAPFGAMGALAGILIATMLLTELISNNAAAVLAFPVAVATALTTGSDPRPFVVAVTMGASLSFLTPIGYQTNLMVYGLGGYRFADFSRLGAPVNIVVFILAMIFIPLVFPL